MNLKQKIKQIVGTKKYPKLKRVTIGKAIITWALIPLNLSFWMLPIGIFLATGIKPSTLIQGKLNTMKGNGDLQIWKA